MDMVPVFDDAIVFRDRIYNRRGSGQCFTPYFTGGFSLEPVLRVFIDVIIKRWEDFTGQRAELIQGVD